MADGMQLQPWVERGRRIDAEGTELRPVLLPEGNEILPVPQALWIDPTRRKNAGTEGKAEKCIQPGAANSIVKQLSLLGTSSAMDQFGKAAAKQRTEYQL